MRKSTIIEKLSMNPVGTVYPEEYKKFSEKRVCLWTLLSNFPEEKDLREVGKIFPNLEKQGLLLKLGEYTSLVLANEFLSRARERALSPIIRQLFLLPPRRPSPPKPKPFGIRRQSRRKVVEV
jgi:hypothetical protein